MKIRVTAKNYPQEVLRSETPVLVEFFAVWCGKCAMMEDVLDEIAKEYDGRVKVCQIEIEESAVLAAEFEVGIVPAFVVFRDGKPVNYANAGNLKNSFRIGEKFFPIRKLLCIMIGKLKKWWIRKTT